MDAQLLDIKDLAAMLSMGRRSAREFCRRHGVLPVNVGLGTKSRLRWHRDAVIQMLGTLDARQPRKDIVPRKRGDKTIVGKSIDELLTELAAPMQ